MTNRFKQYSLILMVFTILNASPLLGADVSCGLNLHIENTMILWRHGTMESKELLSVSVNDDSVKEPCRNYFIAFDQGFSPSYNRILQHQGGHVSSIAYNIFKKQNQTGLLKDIPDIFTQDQMIIGQLEHGTLDREHDFFIVMPDKQFSANLVRAGDYEDQVQVKLYSGSLEQPVLEDSKYLSVKFDVPKQLDLSLVESGAAFDLNDTQQNLDFGVLEHRERRDFDAIVVSNSGYFISFSSLNDGRLKHENAQSFVNYSFYVDGVLRSLRGSAYSPAKFVERTIASNHAGHTYNLIIEIGDVTNKLSGHYQDFITITATATD